MKDFEIIRLGIANGNIDIYQSRKLSKDFVHFIFIDEKLKSEKPEESKVTKKRSSMSLIKTENVKPVSHNPKAEKPKTINPKPQNPLNGKPTERLIIDVKNGSF